MPPEAPGIMVYRIFGSFAFSRAVAEREGLQKEENPQRSNQGGLLGVVTSMVRTLCGSEECLACGEQHM